MKTEILWIVIPVLAVLLLIAPFLYYKIRKRYAKKKTAERSTAQKAEELNRDLLPFGFLYDEKQDIIYSAMNPWQRELGYCKLYDDAALTMNMAIQCEPVYFYYDNRRWMIELWKGQYGMTTGGEVGIYVTDKDDISIPGVFEGPFFECAKEEERIPIQFLLYRKNKLLIEREGLHWWLTGFSVGKFTKPWQLSMDIRLTFPNRGMLSAFVHGLQHAGYRRDDYAVYRNTVRVLFEAPKTKQPYRKCRLWFSAVQWLNRFYCFLFRAFTRDYVKTIDKIDYLRFLFPLLYRMVTRLIKPEKMRRLYRSILPEDKGRREVGE